MENGEKIIKKVLEPKMEVKRRAPNGKVEVIYTKSSVKSGERGWLDEAMARLLASKGKVEIVKHN